MDFIYTITWAELMLFCSALLVAVACWPGALKAHRAKDVPGGLDGHSQVTLLMLELVFLLWPWGGALAGFWWTGLPALSALPALAWTRWSVGHNRHVTYHHQLSQLAPCPCGHDPAQEPHDYVVTNPAGFGTVFSPCNKVPRSPGQGMSVPLGQGHAALEAMWPRSERMVRGDNPYAAYFHTPREDDHIWARRNDEMIAAKAAEKGGMS